MIREKFLEQPLSVAMIENTPVGTMVAAASSAGLAYMSFYGLRDFQTLISDSTKSPSRESLSLIQEAIRQVQEYFNHQREVFDLPFDLDGIPEFRKKVLLETSRIPYGETIAYGKLAALVGQPKAARAVGGALAHNPLVLVIPCHRVVAGDGRLHGFSSPGGIKTKEALLKLEGCKIVKKCVAG